MSKWERAKIRLGNMLINLGVKLGGLVPNIIVSTGQVVRLESGDFGKVVVDGGILRQSAGGETIGMDSLHIYSGTVYGPDTQEEWMDYSALLMRRMGLN